MSDNILKWSTKKVTLSIPIGEILTTRGIGPIEIENVDERGVYVVVRGRCEGFVIRGWLVGRELEVDEIDCTGVGSRYVYHSPLRELFRASTGELEAVVFWEGAEIEVLRVRDGVVTEELMEL